MTFSRLVLRSGSARRAFALRSTRLFSSSTVRKTVGTTLSTAFDGCLPLAAPLQAGFAMNIQTRMMSTTSDAKDTPVNSEGAESASTEAEASEEDVPSIKNQSKEKPAEETETKSFQTSGEKLSGETETHQFQAETQELLHIVSRAIYTDKEVFIRELISNASDASEQARFLATTEKLQSSDRPLEIRIYTDSKKNTITIQDFGIGMTKDQLKSHLGTIARSGSKRFLKEFHENKDITSGDDRTSAIIGQFGVGFYSSFMVSDKVEVFSQSARPGHGAHYWKSGPNASFELGNAEGVKRGTKIVINLFDDAKEFSDSASVERIIKRYSSFVPFPIFLNDKKINVFGALWAQPAKSISEEKYAEFYKHLTNAYDTPMDRMHFTSDVPISIQALFFIPEYHTEKYGMSRMDPGVAVYSRKVLIKAKAKEILPDWLRFVKGVVDSEDLPLHISREQLQDSQLIKKINKALVRRLVSHFSTTAKKEKEKYAKFYKEYNTFLKEGVCTDIENKDVIAKLLRFESSKTDAGKYRSFDDYIADSDGKQKNIYYLVSSKRQLAESSPYFEAFKRKNTEVLFMYSPIDEIVMQNLSKYSTRKLVSIEGTDINVEDTDEIDWHDEKKKKFKHVLSSADCEDLCEWMEKILPDRLKSVKSTTRLDESPCIIVDHESASVRGFMKLVNQDNQMNMDVQKQKLEINPNHPTIRGLLYTMNDDEPLAMRVAEQLVDHALIAAGLLDDPRMMLNRMNDLLAIAMDVEGIESEMDEAKLKAAKGGSKATKGEAKATKGEAKAARGEASDKSSESKSAQDSSKGSKPKAAKATKERVDSV